MAANKTSRDRFQVWAFQAGRDGISHDCDTREDALWLAQHLAEMPGTKVEVQRIWMAFDPHEGADVEQRETIYPEV